MRRISETGDDTPTSHPTSGPVIRLDNNDTQYTRHATNTSVQGVLALQS